MNEHVLPINDKRIETATADNMDFDILTVKTSGFENGTRIIADQPFGFGITDDPARQRMLDRTGKATSKAARNKLSFFLKSVCQKRRAYFNKFLFSSIIFVKNLFPSKTTHLPSDPFVAHHLTLVCKDQSAS